MSAPNLPLSARLWWLPLLLAVLVSACEADLGGETALGTVPVVDASICAPDDDGLQLPEGFCAAVVADSVGRARHLAVRENGDVYVRLRDDARGGGTVALRDTTGDGRADVVEYFGDEPGTGIALRDGYLYVASNEEVYRYPLAEDELVPSAPRETVVTGFPEQGSHAAKPIAFDDAGNLYVTVGGPSNACQEEARSPGSPGVDPCPQLERQGGIWRFDADTPGQTQEADGERFATGIRNAVAIDWHGGDLYAVQHGRDQLSFLWPELYTDEESAELPAEELLRVTEGADFGWPYCYYDQLQEQKVLAPEYGGDGEEVGRCADVPAPLVAFPGHWAPNDILFYDGQQFPEPYQGGAFIAFHGSWNRAPQPQQGFRVAFVPFEDGEVAGEWQTFADGFAAADTVASPNDALYRPTGLAQGPDGTLYLADSEMGRIWRIVYAGEEMAAR